LTELTSRRRPALLLAACLFGVAVAVLKGGDAGLRDSIGNISAPWLLLPYLAGMTGRGWRQGALIGAATCFAALAGFYIAEAFVLDLGDHPVLTDLALTLRAGAYYFIAGALAGPVFGAIGGSQRGGSLPAMALMTGFLLAGEPPAVFAALAAEGVDPSFTGMVVAYPVLWIGEILLGVLAAAALLMRHRSMQA
jgi:hypothetical protein